MYYIQLAWGSTLKNMKSASSKIKTLFRGKKKTRGPSISSVEESVSPLTTSESHDTIASTEETGYESDESADNYDQVHFILCCVRFLKPTLFCVYTTSYF